MDNDLKHRSHDPIFSWWAQSICICMLAGVATACFAQTPVTGSTAIPEPSASARELFAKHKDRLVQVRVLLKSAGQQSGLGSGFVVQQMGASQAWVLTNYHVVSALAMEPAKYRLELRGTDGQSVEAELMAVDVNHDLALLRTDVLPQPKIWKTLDLAAAAPAQGSKVYALGNPLELGFLISEGIYNGLVEYRIYDEMLFSGSLNSGMSGGPAIDSAGRVVGVNVATRRDGQQLSFLVPVQFARALLAHGASLKTSPNEWRSEVGRQLLIHQALVTQKLLAPTEPGTGFSTQKLDDSTVPTLGDKLTKCWAGSKTSDNSRFERESLDCDLKASRFVSSGPLGGLAMGSVGVSHVLLRNTGLSGPQFIALGDGRRHSYDFSTVDREVSMQQCQSSYLKATANTFRVNLCVRAYRKFSDLYEFSVSAQQLNLPSQRQVSKLNATGVSFENGQQLTKAFLERLQ